MFKIYDVIIPVGIGCTVSYHLKKNGIRECSLPFDWLYGITIEKAIKLIENSFQDFLDKDSLEFSYVCGPHDVYSNTKLSINFVHDFSSSRAHETKSKDDVFNQTLMEVKNKYARRINRLYNLLSSKKRVLLMHYFDGSAPESFEFLEENRLKFCKLYPNLRIDIIYIYTQNCLIKKYKKINKHIYLIPMPIPSNLSEENRWMGNSKQFKILLKKFTTKNKLKTRILKCLKLKKNKKMFVDHNFFND